MLSFCRATTEYLTKDGERLRKARARFPMRLILTVHLASLHEPRLEEFPVGGGSNKLKVRLGIRNLAALPVLANKRSSDHLRATSAYPPTGDIQAPRPLAIEVQRPFFA